MYFNQLMFLIPMMKNNATNSSITDEPQSETNDSDVYIFATQEEPQSVRSKIKSGPKCDDDGVQTLIAILKDNINAIEARKEMDSDQMFLMSLQDSFKNIPAAANMRAKIELIQTIDRYQPNRLQTELFSQNNYTYPNSFQDPGNSSIPRARTEYNTTDIDAEKEEGVQHTPIMCKNCQNVIVGFRYKCITCEDYDLCKNCELMERHSEHYVLRIPKPLESKEAEEIAQKLQQIFKHNEDIPPIKVKEEDAIGVSIGECGDDEPVLDDNVDEDIHSSEQLKNITHSEASRVIDKSKDVGEPTGTVRRKRKRTAERETVGDGKRMSDADAKVNVAPEIAFADANSDSKDSYIEVEIKQETGEESEIISRLDVGETVNPYVKENKL